MHTLDPRYDWVSTREAAARLRVSQSSVLRLIEDGKLTAERVERPGGTRLLVRFERPQNDAMPAPEPPQHNESSAASEALQAASAALAALVDELAAVRRQHADERQADRQTITTLYEQARETAARAARAESDARHASSRVTELVAEIERERTRAAELARQLADALDAERQARAAAEQARRWWWPF